MAVRVGIVGCGKIARTHAEALSKLEIADFVACCDMDLARAEALAGEFGAARATDDLAGLLASGEVEAVHVCTPHPIHERVVIAAAEAGVHVLCEKPIAITLGEADRMIAATDAAGVKFGMIFQRRFWPAAQRIRAAIDDGKIGTPTLGECFGHIWRPEAYFQSDPWRGTWATEGGGVLMNQVVHAIDQFLWYMGTPVEVTGRIATLKHGAYIDVEDTAVATVVFESGALGTIQAASTVQPNFGFRVAVYGDAGAAVSVWERSEGLQGVNDVWTVAGEEDLREQWEAQDTGHSGFPGFHALQIQDFLEAVRDDRAPAVTGRDGLRSLEVILAIYESSRTGQAVRLPMTRS